MLLCQKDNIMALQLFLETKLGCDNPTIFLLLNLSLSIHNDSNSSQDKNLDTVILKSLFI